MESKKSWEIIGKALKPVSDQLRLKQNQIIFKKAFDRIVLPELTMLGFQRAIPGGYGASSAEIRINMSK